MEEGWPEALRNRGISLGHAHAGYKGNRIRETINQRKMNKPIIDPSTLTEEQREEVRKCVKEIRDNAFPVCEFEEKLMFAEEAISYFYWLFGEEFFKGK